MGEEYLGFRYQIVTLKTFIELTKTPSQRQSFLSRFIESYNELSDFPVDDSQKDAWKECVEVLAETIPELPEAYGELSLIFEYVLPQLAPNAKHFLDLDENHVYADVIALSADIALVMEFKRRSDEVEGLFRQAGLYKRRLESCHGVESWSKDVEAVLVLTKAEDYFNADNYLSGSEGVVSCSPNRLAETLIAVFGEVVEPCPCLPALPNWPDSEYQNKEIEKDYHLNNQNKLERDIRIANLETNRRASALESKSLKNI